RSSSNRYPSAPSTTPCDNRSINPATTTSLPLHAGSMYVDEDRQYHGAGHVGRSRGRPELTLGRAASHVVRRWWLLPLCAVLVAVAAVTLSGHHISDANATARVHIQDTTVSYQFQGQPRPFTAVHSAQDLTKNEFVDPQV